MEVDTNLLRSLRTHLEAAEAGGDANALEFYRHLVSYCTARPGEDEDDVATYIKLYEKCRASLERTSATNPGRGCLLMMMGQITSEAKRKLQMP